MDAPWTWFPRRYETKYEVISNSNSSRAFNNVRVIDPIDYFKMYPVVNELIDEMEVDECQHSTGFWTPWSRTRACTCINKRRPTYWINHYIHYSISPKKIQNLKEYNIVNCLTRMIFLLGSAVWSFDRRQPFLRCDTITQIVATGIGGWLSRCFLSVKNWRPKKGRKVSHALCLLFSGASDWVGCCCIVGRLDRQSTPIMG